ncbi:MAG: substrate-binding domain-containing protein, partial [Lachnospiraceae bacterium]|nr:substrate-binding domain-containing protein [Lachnospiraceae bacterium]
MMKKVLSIFLTAALSVSLLAGCGGGGANTAAEKATDAAAKASAAVDTAASAADTAASAADTAASAADAAASAVDTAASAAVDAVTANPELASKKVGVCIYQFSDNFMTLFRTELENYLVSCGFDKANISIVDGANDQATQSGQIDNFIADGVDVLIINLVNSSSAATVTDKVVGANIPLVYINREPDADEEKRWKDNNWDVCYVGCDARQSGTYQGEIIADIGLDKIDMNGNGKIDYIMIEGDPENVDAKYRTEFSVKALTDAGLEVNCLDDQVGMWDQVKGQELVGNALSQHGNDIEVVF